MNTVLHWLSQQAIYLYVLCMFGAIAYALSALSSRRRRDAAQFSLERDVNQQRMLRYFLISGLFLLLGVLVFFVEGYVAPLTEKPVEATPTTVGLITPTPLPTLIPTAMLTPLTETPGVITQTLTPAAVEMSPSTPSPTPSPTVAEVPQPDCPLPNAQLTSPVAGENVSGLVEIQGTATINAFSYYKFEVQFPGSDTPNFISQYDVEVENGVLGYWDVSDTTLYPEGAFYSFRLVVVDIYGNTAKCVIPVAITRESE